MVLRYSNHSTFIRRAVFVECLPWRNVPRFIGCHALCKVCAGSLSLSPKNKRQFSTMHEKRAGKWLAFVWCDTMYQSEQTGSELSSSERANVQSQTSLLLCRTVYQLIFPSLLDTCYDRIFKYYSLFRTHPLHTTTTLIFVHVISLFILIYIIRLVKNRI